MLTPFKRVFVQQFRDAMLSMGLNDSVQGVRGLSAPLVGTIKDCEADFAFRHGLFADRGARRGTAVVAAKTDQLGLEPQAVARVCRRAELPLIQARQHGQLAAIRLQTERCDTADFGQRFNDDRPGHNGKTWEVATQHVLFVSTHVVEHADRALAEFDLNDAVHKDKGCAVRNDRLDLAAIELRVAQTAPPTGMRGLPGSGSHTE